MFTTHMYVEDWGRESHLYNGEKIDSFSRVLETLDSLDGDRRPQFLVAEAAPPPEWDHPYYGTAMVVASGPDGYMCTVYTCDDSECFVMSSGGECDGIFKMISRPYPEQVPANQVVSKSDAIRALKQFAEDGSMAGEFRWKKYR